MSEWQPIETAPKTSKAILVWVPQNKCMFCVTWSKSSHDEESDPSGWVIFGGGYRSYLRDGSPTLWMPLPPPPSHAAP